MEEEEEQKMKKKGPINIDWEVLLPHRDDDDPPPLLVVATAKPPSALPMGGDRQEQLQREELKRMSDNELDKAILRIRRSAETLAPQLSDGGEKLRASLKRHEEERQRRRLCPPPKVDYRGAKLMQSESPCYTGASDCFRQESPSSLPPSQSSFTTHFYRKLEEKTNSRSVDPFEKELSYLGRDPRRVRRSGKFSPRKRPKAALSSRPSPFQCRTISSVDVDELVSSDGDRNGGYCSNHSTHHIEEKLSGSFSKKRNASKILPSNDLRPRNGKTFNLVDEEEPQHMELIKQADKVHECIKESKIYYPSSDDPESIEICYLDMECLAPEAFLSSTIMNFYIRYLQQNTSPTDSARSGYHIFNTYFYQKLKEAVLNKNDRDGSFVKFRRWWKGVNIFHNAYILLPIHENLHWSLVIICIPDEEDESGPFILHLDSLGLHWSKQIFDNIKSFLREEWKYLNLEGPPPDLPIATRIWENLPWRIEEKTVVVPQQRNDYDCGLFVLFFMERFIDEAPPRMKKQDLAMFGKNWFRPEEASNLRWKIRELLVEEFVNITKEN